VINKYHRVYIKQVIGRHIKNGIYIYKTAFDGAKRTCRAVEIQRSLCGFRDGSANLMNDHGRSAIMLLAVLIHCVCVPTMKITRLRRRSI